MKLKTKKQKMFFAASVLFLQVFSNNLIYAAEPNIANVIIVTLSGVRNEESVADPERQYMPHLLGDMLPEGVLYTNVISVAQHFHMPTFNEINTGQKFPLWYDAKTPTIFQYVKKKYNWPASRFWMIGQWQNSGVNAETEDYPEDTYPNCVSVKFEMPLELEQKLSRQEKNLLRLLREGAREFSGFSFSVWDSYDELTYRLLNKIVLNYKPKLMHYMLSGPETAHYDSFARYVLSLKRNDEMIYEIWKKINTDPFYKDNTFLFVTPNIVRDGYYRNHNANPYDNPASTWLYVFGPKIKKGLTVKRSVYHVDIFPTVARIMQTEVPPGDGKILFECKKD